MKTQTATTTVKRPRRWVRWARRTAIVLVSLYLVGGILAWIFQERLLFPGSWVHSRRIDAYPPLEAGIEVVPLTTASGHKTVAMFGAALAADGSPLADASRRPTVMYYYGNGDCLMIRQWHVGKLRRLGANVLAAEYVGYGLAEGSPSVAACLETAEAAFAHVRARPDVDPERIVPVGWSLGSGVASTLAARHQGEGIAAVALLSAYTTLEDAGQSQYWFLPTKWLMRQRLNSIDNVRQLRVPLLIAHGRRDRAIPFQMSLELQTAATASPHVTHVAVNAGHGDLFEREGDLVFGAIGKLLDEIQK